MYYSNNRIKEEEKFPNIMTKEDTKELSSIINLLNSKSNPDEKIGLNLQYRQVKLPKNIYILLKERKKNSQNYLEKEKKDANIKSIIAQYEENKSIEEQYIRGKKFEIDSLDKKIKKLNLEEIELSQEVNNFNNKLDNLAEKMKSTQMERDKIKNIIKASELEEKNMKNKISELEEKNRINYNKIKKLNELKTYLKEKKQVNEDEINIKKMLCYECKNQPRIYYYAKCQHLALCENCYAKMKQNSKCPICNENNELVVKVYLENTNDEYI